MIILPLQSFLFRWLSLVPTKADYVVIEAKCYLGLFFSWNQSKRFSIRTYSNEKQNNIKNKKVKKKKHTETIRHFSEIELVSMTSCRYNLGLKCWKKFPLPPFQCWGKNSCALIALVSPTLNGGAGEISKTIRPRL